MQKMPRRRPKAQKRRKPVGFGEVAFAHRYMDFEFRSRDSIYCRLNRDLVSQLRLKPTDRVLSVGEGTGFTAYQIWPKIRRQGAFVGVEPSRAMAGWLQAYLSPKPGIATYKPYSKKEALPKNARIVIGKAERLSALLPGRKFDKVVFSSSIHWTNMGRAIRESSKVIKKGGTLVLNAVATAGFDLPKNPLYPLVTDHPLYNAFRSEIERNLAARGITDVKMPSPKPRFKTTDLLREIERNGFQIVSKAIKNVPLSEDYAVHTLRFSAQMHFSKSRQISKLSAKERNAIIERVIPRALERARQQKPHALGLVERHMVIVAEKK